MRAPTQYPKRSRQQWEELRQQAASRYVQGQRIGEVAQALNVSPEAARLWFHKWKAGGVQALRRKSPGGPKAKLSPEQLGQLETELLKGPTAQGYQTDFWTLERITHLIRKLFGVRYHRGHVFRLLRAMGWTCQKPTRRARERDEAAIQRWLRQDWPRIKKGQNARAPR
jgi:transposase